MLNFKNKEKKLDEIANKLNSEKEKKNFFSGSAKIAPTEANLNKYKDSEGLTVGKMNFGLWFLEYKSKLLALLALTLIVISAISWSYTLYVLGHYFIFGMKQDQELAQNLTQDNLVGHDYILSISARDLSVSEIQIFNSNDNYDFLAVVENSNKKHFGRFEYSFIVDNEKTEKITGFIMPGQTKYIVGLGQAAPGQPNSVNLIFDSMSWLRLDPHNYPDWEDFYQNRMNIIVDNIEYTPARSTTLTEKINLNELSFNAENNTAYNYRDINFIILLKLADRIIGINKYVVNNLMSGEKRNINITWPGRFGRVGEVDIIPEVDIIENNNYIDFIGEIDNYGPY
ncbi:MAG: hypothetical protein U9R06_03600 [Patescibacteria group bacterium]|nr:hypothetical protein [Patescibacteria group bacterium]